MIPINYNEWRNCIENDCKIRLSKTFIDKRLKIYSNLDNPETKKFVQLYGINHLKNILNWLKQASEK